MAELLLSIAVESIETKRKGYLKIYRNNDVRHTVQYKDNYEFINVDIDCVHIEMKRQLVRFHEDNDDDKTHSDIPLKCSFRVMERRHLQLFFDTQRECQEICNLTLELSSRLRDVYYATMCGNNSFPDVLNESASYCSDEILHLQNEAVEQLIHQNLKSFTTASGDLFPYYATSLKVNGPMPSHLTAATATSSSVLHHHSSNTSSTFLPSTLSTSSFSAPYHCLSKKAPDCVKCFYCGEKSGVENAQRKFYIHPYVPTTFDRKPMIMCSICIENWNDYRERAEVEDQLILPGEVNEELCCLCSDTPEELILCSTCQRSYCDGCLQRTVTDRKEYQRIIAQSDWKCFCCVNRVDSKPLLSKDAWRIWIGSGSDVMKGKRLVSGLAAEYRNPPIRPFRGVVTKPSSHEKKTRPSAINDQSLVGNSMNLVGNSMNVPLVNRGLEVVHVPTASNVTEATEKISPFVVLDTSTNSNTNLSVQHMPNKKRNNTTSRKIAKNDTTVDAPVNTNSSGNTLDEVYYFSQYVSNLEESYSQLNEVLETISRTGKSVKKLQSFPTDEVCFLCKDGGDLIECDYCNQKGKHSLRCLKVYHSGCLNFQVEDNVEWFCPRHFCSCCGSKQLRYMCMFCPISICADCPQKLVDTYGLNRFCEIVGKHVGEFAGSDILPIACENCIVLHDKANNRKALQSSSHPTYTKLGSEQKFTDLTGKQSVLVEPIIPALMSVSTASSQMEGIAPEKKKRRRST